MPAIRQTNDANPRVRLPGLTGMLTLYVALALMLVGLVFELLVWLTAGIPIRRELERQSQAMAARLADLVAKDLWNLDAARVAVLFERYPMPPQLARVTVTTEFGDPFYERTFQAETEAVVAARHGVVYKGQRIGELEVAVSTAQERRVRQALEYWGIGILVAAMLTAFLVISVQLRFMLGKPLARLLDGINDLALGHYSRRLPPAAYREFDAIHDEVNRMAAQIAARTSQLETMRDRLEELVKVRTEELARRNRQLERETAVRREAQRRLGLVASLEQERIGRELHDTVGQELTALSFKAAAQVDRIRRACPTEGAAAKTLAEEIRQVLIHIKDISRGLFPLELSGQAVVQRLKSLVEETGRACHVACRFTFAGDAEDLVDVRACSHLLRIAQEAIANAINHGHPQHVDVILDISGPEGCLIIADDGHGIATEPGPRKGIGMMTMQSRADLLGGSFSVRPAEGHGTVVTVLFPLPPSCGGD